MTTISVKGLTLPEAAPHLAAEWDTERNSTPPDQVTASAHTLAWWICPKGHSYQAWLNNRTRRGSGCTFCNGRRILPGFNDLATTHPDIAAAWIDDLNGDLTPQQVSAGMQIKVWLRCPEGHQANTSLHSATSTGRVPCTQCHPSSAAPRKSPVPNTSLAQARPNLAAEWHQHLNGNLTPDQVSYAARIRVWWQCSRCGHQWQAYVSNRGGKPQSGCPCCKRTRHGCDGTIPGPTLHAETFTR